MLDQPGMCQCRDRTAQRLRHVGMALAEGFHGNLVDEAGRLRIKPWSLWQRLGHDCFWHQLRSVADRTARRHQIWMQCEMPVKRRGIGIDKQRGWIETMAVGWIERPVGPQAIAHARYRTRNESVMYVVGSARKRQPGYLPVILVVKNTNPDTFGMVRQHSQIDATLLSARA